MDQSVSADVRGSSQGLKETAFPVSVLERQNIQSGYYSVREFRHGLLSQRSDGLNLRIQRVQSGYEG